MGCDTLLIEDFISKGEFSVVSVFRPEENAIDLVESEPETFVFPIFYYVVSREEWVGTEENPGHVECDCLGVLVVQPPCPERQKTS